MLESNYIHCLAGNKVDVGEELPRERSYPIISHLACLMNYYLPLREKVIGYQRVNAFEQVVLMSICLLTAKENKARQLTAASCMDIGGGVVLGMKRRGVRFIVPDECRPIPPPAASQHSPHDSALSQRCRISIV